MKPLPMLSAVAVFFVLCTAGTSAQEKLTLTYRFTPGATYLYADTVRSTQSQEMMGQEMKITTFGTSQARIVVEAQRADGVLSLVTSLDSMRVTSKTPMRDTTLVMKDLLGKRTRILLQANGTVTNREIIDSMKLSGIMARSMSMRETARFHRLPKDPVAVGGTWKSDVIDSTDMMGGNVISHHQLEYTVAGTAMRGTHSCLQIVFKGDIGVEGKGSMMGSELFIEGKGKTTGTVVFDPARGIVVSEEASTDIEMTAAVTGQQNMTIPISQSARTVHVLISIAGGGN